VCEQRAQRQKIMKEKAARLAIKRQQQAIRAAEVAEEKARHEALVRWVPAHSLAPLLSRWF
jgi:hypothetical protein